MSDKINWNLTSQQFGEAFNYALQNERKRKQEQDQFNQQMAFENRQLNLLDTYRNNALTQDESQFTRKLGEDTRQFDLAEKLKENIFGEDIRQFDTAQKFKENELAQNLNLENKKLGQDESQFTRTLKYKYDELGITDALGRLKLDTINSKDTARSKYISGLVGNINYSIDSNDSGQLKRYTEQLLDFTDLKQPADYMLKIKKAGLGEDDAIKMINEDRIKDKLSPLTQDEEKYLRLYWTSQEERNSGWFGNQGLFGINGVPIL